MGILSPVVTGKCCLLGGMVTIFIHLEKINEDFVSWPSAIKQDAMQASLREVGVIGNSVLDGSLHALVSAMDQGHSGSRFN